MQSRQHLCMLDSHRLQIVRVESEQLQDRRRDLRRLDPLAVRVGFHISWCVDEDRNIAVSGVVTTMLCDLAAAGVDYADLYPPEHVWVARVGNWHAEEVGCRFACIDFRETRVWHGHGRTVIEFAWCAVVQQVALDKVRCRLCLD